MSFLDDQATGQIGIGEKASLSTLTRRKRKRKRGQAPTGAETYSLLPQNEFSNLVSSPTDITQVGIGEKLQAQGTAAGDVPNVFDEYVSAAPKGTTLEAIYYQPPPDDDDDDDDDDDLPSVEDDPYVPDADPGIGEGDPLSYGDPYNIPEGSLLANLLNFFEPITRTAANTMDRAIHGFPEGVTQTFNELDTDNDNKITTGDDFANYPNSAVPPAAIAAPAPSDYDVSINAGTPSYSGPGGTGSGGGDVAAPGSTPDDGYGIFASGGTVTKSKAKNKNSFMSMKGK